MFRFKQFTVQQDRCGMKVTTDACLFGASVALQKGVQQALDIGTGTGLLSLMLAQRLREAHITALEIDEEAAKQAAANFTVSPWRHRLHLQPRSLQAFCSGSPPATFDLIISNPPFFGRHLTGQDAARRRALHHDGTLPPETLAEAAVKLLRAGGRLWVMYPEAQMQYFIRTAAAEGLWLNHLIRVCNREAGPVLRQFACFCSCPAAAIKEETITIYAAPGTYTSAFIERLQPFYLNL